MACVIDDGRGKKRKKVADTKSQQKVNNGNGQEGHQATIIKQESEEAPPGKGLKEPRQLTGTG